MSLAHVVLRIVATCTSRQLLHVSDLAGPTPRRTQFDRTFLRLFCTIVCAVMMDQRGWKRVAAGVM